MVCQKVVTDEREVSMGITFVIRKAGLSKVVVFMKVVSQRTWCFTRVVSQRTWCFTVPGSPIPTVVHPFTYVYSNNLNTNQFFNTDTPSIHRQTAQLTKQLPYLHSNSPSNMLLAINEALFLLTEQSHKR